MLKNDGWRKSNEVHRIRQGYIFTGKGKNVRVRIVDQSAYLTIKGPKNGLSRSEYEYPIPLNDATEMLNLLCELPIIEKNRHVIQWGDHTWEIDEFLGENKGLILAEVELNTDHDDIQIPPWIGEEVSGNRAYYNVNLARHPYTQWSK